MSRKETRLKWYYENKEYHREYQARIRKERRDAWLEENGPCQECGSGNDLQVDHIVPINMNERPDIWRISEERRAIELAKCQVLCKECHLKKTLSDRGVRPQIEHGTYTSYCKGACRCNACSEAGHEYYLRKKERNS